ncbi:MAG: UTP--glucose-1-phosphate uridylyltransferase [Bdellovibrionaceae bacterium]|nr:UTP--glucose-1-phosphate uridylyltransferase [Pseudobdellovibrionaceae bacterium]
MKKINHIPVVVGLIFSNFAYSHQCLKNYSYKEFLNQMTLGEAKSRFGLNLDESNFAYLKMLLKLAYDKSNNDKPIKLFDPSKQESDSSVQTVYLVANAPDKLVSEINLTNYNDLLKRQAELIPLARGVTLNLHSMQAGTGTSVDRNSYLSKRLGIPSEKVRNGAKATDLYIPGTDMSIAEALMHKAFVKSDLYKGIIYTDLVSGETQDSIEKAWKHVSAERPDMKGLRRGGKIIQHQIPTLNDQKQLSTNRLAPGGHGFFAINLIERLLAKTPAETKNQFSVISNGEDLSGSPDPLIVAHMKKNKIPIMMVTTEKTEIDLKGGQIGIAEGRNKNGQTFFYPTIVEHAQAERADQKTFFEKMGLTVGTRKSLFNTNMVIINEEVLAPLLRTEIEKIGLSNLFKEISPALIQNNKKQVDKDGVKRVYTQLEGAMGSIMLKLDQHFRSTNNIPLITFMNIEREHRTNFFAPIKTAFDYWMLLHSDRFEFNKETFTLKDLAPGFLPTIKLQDRETEDKHYANVENILEAFNGTKILELDELTISGKVNLSGLTLKGKVEIINQTENPISSEQIRILFQHKKFIKDVKITFEKSGLIHIEELS